MGSPHISAEELFSKLASGEKFAKLDLFHAYQQMVLEESSKELVTVNTHQGLHLYTRLSFGIASAPTIFQQTMDGILQRMESVSLMTFSSLEWMMKTT